MRGRLQKADEGMSGTQQMSVGVSGVGCYFDKSGDDVWCFRGQCVPIMP